MLVKRSQNPIFGRTCMDQTALHRAQDKAMRPFVDSHFVLWGDFNEFLPTPFTRPEFLLLCRLGRAPNYFRAGNNATAPIWTRESILETFSSHCPDAHFDALKVAWAKDKRSKAKKAKGKTGKKNEEDGDHGGN